MHDKYLVLRRWSMTSLYDFVGITFSSHYILKIHDCFLVCLKYYCFYYVNIKLLFWISWTWIFIPQLRRITLKLCQIALRIKNSVFIIYLLEDEQELSLGMLIRLQRIYNFWYSFSSKHWNKGKTGTGTGLWVNRLVPKII